ncbi:aldo/keto reductase [Galbitalea soli]|nr:aldo/keto reductase [Galbitalea soli]NYJ30474.1 2,5-diketo-D-gluconate reductase A [Galbitalea soli]
MTSPTFSPSLRLSDGHSIPQLGLGVYKVADAHATELVAGAIELGYRHLDTATLYDNERGVGEGMRASGVDRSELFLTTKLWNDDHGYDRALRAFDRSLELLGLDYVDLYLIHWPCPAQDRYVESWRALLRLRDEGRVRSVGVSNFAIPHLERIIAETGEAPVINQVELHPWLPQSAVRAFDRSQGILTESWSPLARGRVLDDPVIGAIAERLGRSPAQVVVRWHLQAGVVVIPKSNSLARVAENARVFDFELSDDDLSRIAALESGERTGKDPEHFG